MGNWDGRVTWMIAAKQNKKLNMAFWGGGESVKMADAKSSVSRH